MKLLNGISILAFGMGALVFSSTSALAKKGALPDLAKLCKKECPGAADLKAVMECVEKQEHAYGPEGDKFKKTKCFITHEKHEAEYNKMAGLPVGHDEANEKK